MIKLIRKIKLFLFDIFSPEYKKDPRYYQALFDVNLAYEFCRELKQRIPELEELILTDPKITLKYAIYVVKERFLEGEEVMGKHDWDLPSLWPGYFDPPNNKSMLYKYIRFLKEPAPLMEPVFAKDWDLAIEYLSNLTLLYINDLYSLTNERKYIEKLMWTARGPESRLKRMINYRKKLENLRRKNANK